MHKPIRIIKDDARVRLTQQVNLTSAVRTALLTLPAEFSERELFERIAGFSYSGDVRMVLPAENRGKVGNIVRKQAPQFKELYHRLVVALPGVHWPAHTTTIQQDTSPHARAAHLRKLPSTLLAHVTDHYAGQPSIPAREADETVYWSKLAGDANLSSVIEQGGLMALYRLEDFWLTPFTELAKIVRGPSTVQTLKGLVSAGPVKSVRYAASKVNKWWKGSSKSSSGSNSGPDAGSGSGSKP